jgi:hypothetical protein
MLRVALCAALLGVAGCSGDGTAATTASTTTTTIPATTTTLPLLVDAYDLGVAFHLGAADGTVGLFIEFTDHDAAARGDIPEVSVLPDGRWTAEVHIGHDLFASWGRDVRPSDPRPVVDEVWPVVAGTITILEMDMPSTGCGVARALLVGLEAVTGDGTRVHLGDFEVENLMWGCFVP